MPDASVPAAIIGAIAALVGAGVGATASVVVGRWTYNSKIKELNQTFETKNAELKQTANLKMDELVQTQLRDILTKRMNAYQALWRILQKYTSDWGIEGKRPDRQWATEFLVQLVACHQEHGVFFGQPVYDPFFEFRDRLIEIVSAFGPGKNEAPEALATLDELWSRGGLATEMKDALGSYADTIFERTRKGTRSQAVI